MPNRMLANVNTPATSALRNVERKVADLVEDNFRLLPHLGFAEPESFISFADALDIRVSSVMIAVKLLRQEAVRELNAQKAVAV